MEKLLGVCGVDCSTCPAYIATMNDDNELRSKTAIEWSQGYSVNLKPENIHCVGCVATEGVHFAHCNECDVRLCGLDKNLTSCGNCDDYPCDMLDKIFQVDPSAKGRLDDVRAR